MQCVKTVNMYPSLIPWKWHALSLILSSVAFVFTGLFFHFLLSHPQVTMWINIASNNQNYYVYIVVVVFIRPDCSTRLPTLMGLGCSLLFKLTLDIRAVNYSSWRAHHLQLPFKTACDDVKPKRGTGLPYIAPFAILIKRYQFINIVNIFFLPN